MLSGDIITEQNIHAIDVASWVLDAQPLQACGTGGRRSETAGDCSDHFAVVFSYPNELVVSFNSQQADYGYDDILCRVYGLKGTVDTHYFGRVTIKAKEYHSDEAVGNLYTEGVVSNIATFHENISKGQYDNETVPASVRSNLTTILGRMAAYNNAIVSWREMMRTNQKFSPDLKGLKA
jgi:predicted dehydrogenase